MRASSRICSIEGCGKKHSARGFCKSHYILVRYNTDPEFKRRIRASMDRWKMNNQEKFRESNNRYYKEHSAKIRSSIIGSQIRTGNYPYEIGSKRGIDNLNIRKAEYNRQMRNFVRQYDKKK